MHDDSSPNPDAKPNPNPKASRKRRVASPMGALSLAAAGALGRPATPESPPATSASASALARMRDLAGDWEGTVEWTGARTSKGTMNATYHATSYGSAVVEDLISEGQPVMMSVYHQDGPDLRVTHYCGAQNQPRLKATRIDMAGGAIDFEFVDATNMKSPDAPHVHGIELRFADADHMVLTFLFHEGAKRSREAITLKRVHKA